jgi:mono/diheme cytochrome c family protein
MLRVARTLSMAAMATAVLGLSAAPGIAQQPKAAAAASKQPAKAQSEARLARGKYLVEHVGICLYCHSQIDWKAPGFPQVAGTQGGGAVFPDKSVPGLAVARNITPEGLRDCTDQQIERAIREGVACDGSRIFPVMPYHFFRVMSDDDVAAVIAYLRTLPPVKSDLPKTRIPDEVWAAIPPLPPVTEPVSAPPRSDKVAYGRYLTNIGLCVECHTPVDQTGAPLPGLAYAGGRILDGPWGRVASANLTPDPSGIPYYDEALFRSVLHTCKVKARELNHIMPCEYFKGMSDEDVSAIFAFLKSLPPVEHNVSNIDPPTPCPRCGQSHGLGDHNKPMPPKP